MPFNPRILICGALANKPFNGGNAWSRLSWVLGFRRLGYKVSFIEQIAPRELTPLSLKYFHSTMEQFGLQHDSALLSDDGSVAAGASLSDLVALAKDAILFNLGGHLQLSDILSAARF